METAGHHMKTQHTYLRPFGTPSDSIPKLRRSSTGRPAENHLKTCWTSSGRTAEFQLGYHLKTWIKPGTSGDVWDITRRPVDTIKGSTWRAPEDGITLGTSGDLLNITWDTTSTSLEDLLWSSHGDHLKTWIKPGTSGDVLRHHLKIHCRYPDTLWKITRRLVDIIKASTWRAPEDGTTPGTSGDLLHCNWNVAQR